MERKLEERAARPDRPAENSGDSAHLLPVLVDCNGRDGSTLMMRLLATSPQIAAPGPYPYETKYFAYLWRWSRMLERRDNSELWTDRDLASLAQEARKPIMGPPRWSFTILGGAGSTQPPMSRQMFDLAWGEFSQRAAKQVREEHGPTAEVRYYGEKHRDTWLVDLDELPPLKVLVLLRDPRDTFVSSHAFDAKRRRENRGRFIGALPGWGETPEDMIARFIERERERLRWIAGLPSGQRFPLFRYEDLVTDLRGEARRLEGWLSVRLDPEAAAGDTQMRGAHVSAQTPEASVGRWRREMRPELAEQLNRELGEELEALGYELPRSALRQGSPRRPSSWLRTPDAVPHSPVKGQGMEAVLRLPDLRGQHSLANLKEILFPCLDAIAARSVVEIGAHWGELTRELLDWAASGKARVTAVDPDPAGELLALGQQHPELELVLETSHDALRRLPLPDAVIIDGDHNYYTLSEELRLIGERAPGAELPLLMLHDVGWPHARRDTYCAPGRIPEEHRQPLARDVALAPWEPGLADGGLSFEWAAESEGGPRNGVLTALEDFVGERPGLRLVIFSAFLGFGVLWHRDAPWASAVASIVEPWDRNPLLERLEANRVEHLAARHVLTRELEDARRDAAEQTQRLRERTQRQREQAEQRREQAEQRREQAERQREQRKLLRAMLGSRAFAVAEQLSRLHQRGRPVFSREQVRRALGEEDGRA